MAHGELHQEDGDMPYDGAVLEPRFLVVDDDPSVARALAKIVRRRGEPVLATNVDEALGVLQDGSEWAGFIIDMLLPGGTGLDVLARARVVQPLSPAMVLTGRHQDLWVNAVHDLHAEYVLKPVQAERVGRFLEDALSIAPRVERAVQGVALACGLSDAEADIVRRAALGESRATIAQARRSSEATVKRQVANVLRLTGDASLHALVERILRDVARA
jgi:two-component system, chemotaxis family, CheB/CheR fusion protein